MYPTKNILDDVVEMNRLFPRTSENEMLFSPTTRSTSHRSFNQYSMAQSSSSTDTSPDSFPDLMAHQLQPELLQHYEIQRDNFGYYRHETRTQYETPTLGQYYMNRSELPDNPFSPQMHEAPQIMRYQRPIVGRKILAATDSQIHRHEVSNVAWPDDSLQHTPPNTDMNQNICYELFPADKGTEFCTPVKRPSSSTTSPMLNVSPRMTVSPSMTNMSNMSPRMGDVSSMMSRRMSDSSPGVMSQRMSDSSSGMMSQRMSDSSPGMTMSQRMVDVSPSMTMSPRSPSSYSARFSTPTFKEPILGQIPYRPNVGTPRMCTFCRKNGETPLVYMTHAVKEKVGNKHVVTCPILRSHVCSTCGSSGDDAHTITYCPVLRSSNNGQPLQSTTITLKNTRVKSNGRRRY